MSLNICNDEHEEVCYEGRYCPACAVVERVRALEGELSDVRRELEDALNKEE